MTGAVFPVCPLCRLYVEAAVRGSPFEAAGKAEGFCTCGPSARAAAASQEDTQQLALAKQPGGALPSLPPPQAAQPKGGDPL